MFLNFLGSNRIYLDVIFFIFFVTFLSIIIVFIYLFKETSKGKFYQMT
jgi:hypothetical protein